MKILQCILLAVILLIPSYLVYEANMQRAQWLVAEKAPTVGDQDGIYQTFKGAFDGSGEIPPGVKNGWMAVGYLSLIGFYHKSSSIWTTPDIYASFVYNGVIYGILTALISILLMYKVGRDQAPQARKIPLALGCVGFWFAMFRLSLILRFTYIPWSHYASAFMGLSFIASFYQTLMRKKWYWIFLTAFFGTLFLFARRHEAMAVLASAFLLLSFILVQAILQQRLRFHPQRMALFAVGALIGVGTGLSFISYFSNGMPLNNHYAQQRQLDSYVDEYLKLYPQMAPVRIVQTFFDPDFYSYGNGYRKRAIVSGAFTPEDFAMPMIFQLPILLFLVPLAVFAILYSVFKIKIWKKPISPAILMLLIGLLSFSFLSGGYLSTAVWGGTHLKNGLVREFILSVLLLTIGAGPALFIQISEWFQKRKLVWQIPVFGIVIGPLLLGQKIFYDDMRLLQFPSTHVDPAASHLKYQCGNGHCSVNMAFLNVSGKILQPPFDHVILNFQCGAGIEGKPKDVLEAGLTKHGMDFEFDIIKCATHVDVQVYPLFTGYCGSGSPSLKFSACPSQILSPDCRLPEVKSL